MSEAHALLEMNPQAYNEPTGATKYREDVKSRCRSNPDLQHLSDFLESPLRRDNSCKIVCLDAFNRDNGASPYREIPKTELATLLEHPQPENSPLSGQIIIVQDLEPNVVAILGSNLQINPLFFAQHLFCGRNEKTTIKGAPSGLPSATATSQYYSFRYYKPMVLGNVDVPATSRLLCWSNVRRIVGIMQDRRAAADGQCVAFSARMFSILLCQRKNGKWICVILVDPLIENPFLEDIPSQDGNQKAQIGECEIRAFRGGYVDFMNPTPQTGCTCRGSMCDDLIHYLTTEWPPNFNTRSPDLSALSYYPLKIAVAEWMAFINAMEYAVEGYEYFIEGHWLTDLPSLEASHRTLLGWRRRSRDMAAVVRSTEEFIRQRNPHKSDPWVSMADDYKHISRYLDHLGRRFEALSPAVASLIQVAEGRRLLKLTHLTLVLTLLFLPLTFAASLLSMSGDAAPGGKRFWIYFVVAAPLVLSIFGIMTYKHGLRFRRNSVRLESYC